MAKLQKISGRNRGLNQCHAHDEISDHAECQFGTEQHRFLFWIPLPSVRVRPAVFRHVVSAMPCGHAGADTNGLVAVGGCKDGSRFVHETGADLGSANPGDFYSGTFFLVVFALAEHADADDVGSLAGCTDLFACRCLVLDCDADSRISERRMPRTVMDPVASAAEKGRDLRPTRRHFVVRAPVLVASPKMHAYPSLDCGQ